MVLERPLAQTTTSAGIVIIGTGFAGLGMAIRLRAAGIRDFVMLERARDIGGTWRDNQYPGCACDIPSELYSFSFARNPKWTRVYPTQPEIHAYLRDCVDRYDLERHIRYESDVIEARYDAERVLWQIETRSGTRFEAAVLISGMGGLSNPAMPQIPGLAEFEGPQFHSARWEYDVDLVGKRVAVIGTGASVIQFVPQIAPNALRLEIFQRTPPWILPKPDGPIAAWKRFLLNDVPGLAWAHRASIYLTHEARALGFIVNPKLLMTFESIAKKHIARKIADPVLRATVTPDYRLGCKRVLISNDYYPALNRENVAVVTSEIARVEGDAVVTRDGVRHPADVIVYGTGFRAQDGLAPVRILGLGGRSLTDAWDDGMEAFLGTSVTGFPNLFTLVGPNVILGHNSMIYMIESQIAYVLDALHHLRKRGALALDVLPEVQRSFNDEIRAKTKKTVWQSGCRSWYLDKNGRNTSLWPGFTFDFRRRTRRIEPSRYRWIGR